MACKEGVQLWDRSTEVRIGTLAITGGACSVAFNPSQTVLAAASGEAAIWSVSVCSLEEFASQEAAIRVGINEHREELLRNKELRTKSEEVKQSLREKDRIRAVEAAKSRSAEIERADAQAEAKKRSKTETLRSQIERLVKEAKAEEARQKARWLRKPDYTEAIRLYEEAGDLGSTESYSNAARLRMLK